VLKADPPITEANNKKSYPHKVEPPAKTVKLIVLNNGTGNNQIVNLCILLLLAMYSSKKLEGLRWKRIKGISIRSNKIYWLVIGISLVLLIRSVLIRSPVIVILLIIVIKSI
jgi:phosphatidylserine synthase